MAVEEVEKKGSGGVGETISIIVQALLLAVILRTLLFQPFSIPSGSMIPSLLVGDYLFVSKYSYGYSKHSLPYSPNLFGGRIFGAEPERGDVAVFKYPPNPTIDYIKRIIGLPGDKIQMKNGVLFINGVAVKKELTDETYTDDTTGQGPFPVYRETLPNGVSYKTLDITTNGLGDNTRVFEVPPGHYFAMGDNRDNSADSRSRAGFVPHENLVGKAQIIFFSIKDKSHPLAFWKWPADLRFDRLFDGIE